MLLTKLEIKGFKSFADKVTINFDEGITGIVGPNGCGKSNVVDSIRWVLGEQKTKALRSEKMDNVIFNGSKKRKATQLAEASLTFKNTKNLLPTEYSNVTITRRYYRSGESEYELNGVACRLKDITNLFLDTGIASNSYAIIELKMIDDILNDKDNSRRALFEEAAGISKFKIRKKETLRKLEATDTDLDRVEDLLFEIEKNLKTLERQANQTQRYYKLKNEYKTVSIALARLKVQGQKDTLVRLDNDIQQEEEQKIKLSNELASLEVEVEKEKAALIAKEKDLALKQRILNEHVSGIRQYENEKKIKNERLKFLKDRADTLGEGIRQDKQSIERAMFSIEGLEKDKNQKNRELEENKNLQDTAKKKLDQEKEAVDVLRRQFSDLQEKHTQVRDSFFAKSKDLEIKQIQADSLKKELERASSDTSEHSESLAGFVERSRMLEQAIAEKREILDQYRQKEKKNDQRVASLSETIEMIKDELTKNRRKLDAKTNEYKLTKSLVENLEGFPEAIKFLKKQSGWGKEASLLSDIISCEDDYRVTIENYLEPFMNYYVVESEKHAFEAVNLLSDASKGKAHFFIVSAFKNFEAPPTKIYEKCIPATEIVEYEPKFRKLISYLLGNVYVVEGDISDIPQDDTAVFITKNGKFSVRKFMVSGGAVGLFEGKRIGRAKNLEKLDKDINKLHKKIDEIEQSLEKKQVELAKQKSSTLQNEVERLDSEIRQLNDELISLNTKKEQFERMISSTSTKREDIESNLKMLASEIASLKPAVEAFRFDMQNIEKEVGHKKAELQLAGEKLSEITQDYNQKHIAYLQKENALKSIVQEIAFKKNTLEQNQHRLEVNEKQLRDTEGDIKKLLEKSSTEDDELISLYEKKDILEKELNHSEKSYYAQRGKIDETEKQAKEIQRKREAAESILNELRNKISESRVELATLKERLSVEFNLNLEELLKEDDDSFTNNSESELLEEVTRLKEKLDRMGPINPMALEAFEEIKERYEFITAQRKDLLEAKNSLMDTISEIDEVAKTTFLEAFGKIKANFEKVFRTLFTEEDDCDLRLNDPNNPLESAIEIIAKPKGKRPLSINQLSGGEKALTATSLLFSIYLLKPAPFCIFDEVDAPLDDANIDKFNNIIRQFSKDSQFIIVTHNKRTMATTDIIYGITMVEQGVSRVVPVDLREIA